MRSQNIDQKDIKRNCCSNKDTVRRGEKKNKSYRRTKCHQGDPAGTYSMPSLIKFSLKCFRI